MDRARAEYSVTISSELRALRHSARATRGEFSRMGPERLPPEPPAFTSTPVVDASRLDDGAPALLDQPSELEIIPPVDDVTPIAPLFFGADQADWMDLKLRRDGQKALRFRGISLIEILRDQPITETAEPLRAHQKLALYISETGRFVFETSLSVEGSEALRPMFRCEEVETSQDILAKARAFNPGQVFMTPPVQSKTEDAPQAQLLRFHETVLSEFSALLNGN